MPTDPKEPLIVISYAHEDEPATPAEGEVKWLSFVTGYLRPAVKHGAVDLWLDRLMLGGADREREIKRQLSACDIFILLVSPRSLSSDYVVDKEIPIIRGQQANGESVHFYPLVLTPTPKIALDLVRDKNLRPRDGKQLSDFSLNERYRHMSDAADEIAEMAEEIAARKNSGPSDHTQTDAGQAGFASPRTRPRLRLSTGEFGPFFRTKGKMYGAERTYYIKVENVDDEKTCHRGKASRIKYRSPE